MITPRQTSISIARTHRSSSRGLAARLVTSRLSGIRNGALVLRDAHGELEFGDPRSELSARVHVRDPRFWSSVLGRGSIGAAESYVRGEWSVDDLTAAVRVLLRNQDVLQGMEGGMARLSKPVLKLWHALRANTERGSRKNISAHYDLSNELFALFLDPTMTYSCGYFERPESTLEEASVAKIDRLCRKLELRPGQRLLEIGTGWGALAIHAAREYGAQVTTTTISREQHALAAERVRAAGLEGRVTLLLQDYRTLTGTYDRLVSVEMIEAVGHRFYGEFFATCARLLEPDGLMALQAITIADQHYERAKRSVDFIQRHIFPGSCIPSVTALLSAATRASDLRLVAHEDITAHYVRTLAEWRRNFLGRADEVRALGFDDEFVRLWEFYLCYCEGGFAERHTGDVQMVLSRPGHRDRLPCAAS